MHRETVNVWAQLIASIGVVVSLFYLAAQVRQNTRSARAVVIDALARSMHELAFEIATNDGQLSDVCHARPRQQSLSSVSLDV
jgi:hypothetical protein